jgi:rubrerythrin
MDATEREEVQAVRHLVRMETVGYEFYDRLAARTEDPKGRQLFERLRDEEIEHMQLGRQYLHELLGDEEAARILASDVLDEGPFAGWWVFPPAGDQRVDARTEEVQAVQVAIDAEKRSEEFYRDRLTRTDDEKGRWMYEKLAAMEHRHVQLLAWELDYLTKTGYWMDIAEFDVED